MSENTSPYGQFASSCPAPMQRILQVAGCHTAAELAKFFDVPTNTVLHARQNNDIPEKWLLSLLRSKGINPEWILTGSAAKFLFSASEYHDVHTIYLTRTRPAAECTTHELGVELVRRALMDV